MIFARKIEHILDKIDGKYPLVHGNSLDKIAIYIDKYLVPDRIRSYPVKYLIFYNITWRMQPT